MGRGGIGGVLFRDALGFPASLFGLGFISLGLCKVVKLRFAGFKDV